MISLNNIPQNWQIKGIAEVLFFQEGPGVRKWQFYDEGVKLLNVGNINGGKLNLSTTKIHLSKEEAYGKYSHFLVDDGDLLIACSGIVVSNFHNKITFAKKEHLPLCMNTSTMRFKVLDKNQIDLNYFKYFLQTKHFISQLRKLITGSAQLNFGPSHIKKMSICLPSLSEQKKIADILDAADSLRHKDQQLVEHYDRLSQSLFLDMFGDIESNPKQWDIQEFDHFAIIDTNMTRDFEKYAEFPHIGVANIEKNTGKLINYKLVKDEKLKSGKYIFTPKHIIYSKIRPNLNKVATPSFHGLASADSYPIIPKANKATKAFIAYTLRSAYFLDFISKHSNRTNIPKANKTQLRQFSCICPPFLLQNEFSKRIKEIEKQKELAQQSLKKSEDLFNSLLQRAFKGELTHTQ